MAEGNAWFWTIRKKDVPSIIIGMISLHDQEDNNRGFWLDPQWHGNGFMTETVQVVTDFWFNTLNRKVLRTPKSSDNVALNHQSHQRDHMCYISRRFQLPYLLKECCRFLVLFPQITEPLFNPGNMILSGITLLF